MLLVVTTVELGENILFVRGKWEIMSFYVDTVEGYLSWTSPVRLIYISPDHKCITVPDLSTPHCYLQAVATSH